MSDHRTERTVLLLLLLLTGAAAALRLWRLDTLPPGLFLDEAGNGLDALDLLAGRPAIFFWRSLGKEPLLNYLIVPFVALLGQQPLAVRLPAALVGVATIPAVFFLVRELLWREGRPIAAWGALLAAGLVAVSYWGVSINRISFRANTLPLVMALALGCAWRALRIWSMRRDDDGLAAGSCASAGRAASVGALLGLCFYTYLAGRFVYPLAILGLGCLALPLAGRSLLRSRRRELGVIAAACLLVMAPLLTHFALHPDDFLQRARLVVGDEAKPVRGLRWDALAHNTASNLGMFGGQGDSEPRHNIPDRSLLSPWLAALFWAGMAISAGRAARLLTSAGRRSPHAMQSATYAFAVAWFCVMLLPSILASVTPRHMLRTIGALPITYFFPVVALVASWQAASVRLGPAWRRGLAGVLGIAAALLIVGEAAATARDYFGRWAGAPPPYDAFLGSNHAIAEEINRAEAGVAYVVPLNARWMRGGGKYTLDFLVQRPDAVLYFFPGQSAMQASLAAFLQRRQAQTVHLVRMTEGDDVSADPGELASLLLNQVAQPVAVVDGRGYYTEVYRLEGDPGRMVLPQPATPADSVFGDGGRPAVRLVGWGAARSAVAAEASHITSGGRGAVALWWLVERATNRPLSVSLSLLDPTGNTVGQADSLLVDMRPRYSRDWRIGDAPITYHTLIAAAGTPPGVYRLRLSVYDAATGTRLVTGADNRQPRDAVELGEVTVAAPMASAPGYQPSESLPEAIPLAPGALLTGLGPLPAEVAPGLWLDLGLSWRTAGLVGTPTLSAALGERPVAEEAVPLPPDGAWRTVHRIPIPAEQPAGAQRLRIGLSGAGAQVIRWADIGVIRVVEPPLPQERRTDPFLGGISLIGWGLAAAPDGANVTLYWRAERPQAQDYTAFVHLLDSAGRIIAQHDATPGNGQYPSAAWPVNVTVPDHHFLAGAPLGPGMRMRVGLYLPGSNLRLPLEGGGDAVEWSLTR